MVEELHEPDRQIPLVREPRQVVPLVWIRQQHGLLAIGRYVHSRADRRAETGASYSRSLGLKVVFFALASAGLATLWMAVAADMGASLLVIANGLRLLRDD